MQILDSVIKAIGNQPKTNEPALPSTQHSQTLAIHQSEEARKHLAARLYRDFNAMKTYGKEPESLRSIISLFNETLADYTWEEINRAMTEHARKSPEFPTPSDVIALIKESRAAKAKLENIIRFGVDDTIEKIREYRAKKDAGHRLSVKEETILRESGWRLEVVAAQQG